MRSLNSSLTEYGPVQQYQLNICEYAGTGLFVGLFVGANGCDILGWIGALRDQTQLCDIISN